MIFNQSFVALLTLALAVAANPIVIRDSLVTIPFAKHVNLTGSANLVQSDQARAKALKERAEAYRSGNFVEAVGSQPLRSTPVSYVAAIGVGSPPTSYNLIVDTGSSNTWVGAGKGYVTTSTSMSTSNSVAVSYGSGSFSGREFLDQVVVAGLTIASQSIGAATESNGFQPGVDGILGIGPVRLTEGTLSPATNQVIPTVTDNLFAQGHISDNSVAVSFTPLTINAPTNGGITFGGVDSSKFTGSIHFTPITTTFPASAYWGVDQAITYGTTSILSSTAGIVDTGTTLVLIASDAFGRYQAATGSVLDRNTGLLRITPAQFNSLKDLNFEIGGQTFTLTPNAQIWPRSLNTLIGGNANSVYLIVANLGSNSGEGLDFINGQSFLERFYSVYDTGNKRVGLATTQYTTATTN